MPGWALASSYAAGDTTVDVGGDFFDVVELDEGFLAVVGDVTGKGVQAAALTALARHTLATAARFDPSPAAVVGLLNDVLVHRPEISLLTVACAHVVPTRRGRAPAPDQCRPSAARPVAARAGADDDRAARAAAGHDRRGALGAERDRAAPAATRCSSTPTASPTRRPARERFGEERLLGALPGAPAEPREMIARRAEGTTRVPGRRRGRRPRDARPAAGRRRPGARPPLRAAISRR